MYEQNQYIQEEITKGTIQIKLNKAEEIKKEIKDNIKYHLYDDNLILL